MGKQKQLVVKRYKNERQYQRDARKMQAKGYEVVSVTAENQGRGCASWALLGVFALLTKPQNELVVTYRLTVQPDVV